MPAVSVGCLFHGSAMSSGESTVLLRLRAGCRQGAPLSPLLERSGVRGGAWRHRSLSVTAVRCGTVATCTLW